MWGGTWTPKNWIKILTTILANIGRILHTTLTGPSQILLRHLASAKLLYLLFLALKRFYSRTQGFIFSFKYCGKTWNKWVNLVPKWVKTRSIGVKYESKPVNSGLILIVIRKNGKALFLLGLPRKKSLFTNSG